MRIYQGDNGKVMSEVFTKGGVVVDLTGATVALNIKYGDLTYAKNITITDAVNGKYEFTLNSNDLPVSGFYSFQANATFSDNRRVYSDLDRFIVMKALSGTPVVNPGTPGDTSSLSRLGISASGKLTIDGVEQSGGGSGGSLTYATLAELQSAYPNGTTQPVWIVAENSWYYWSGAIVEDTTAPNEVTGLTKTNVTQTGLTLSWTASTSSDIASYEVYNGSTLLTTVTGVTYNVTGLTASTAYTFTVKAKDTTGNVSTGVSTNVTTLAEPEPGDTTAPNNVTNLAYSNVTQTGVTLTWTASTSTDVANYQIYKDGVNIGQASVTEFIITGLTASTAYQFTVKAKDTSANEASGVSVNVTTSAPADTTAPVLTITPAATFTDTQQVTMSTNETATIYYTLDGSAPTTASSVYSTALTLSATTTVKAFARDTAGNSSAVQTATYTKRVLTLLVSDTFDRADSTTSIGVADTGQMWEALRGTWGIKGNQSALITSVSDNAAVVDSGVADGEIEVKFVTLGSNRLVFRASASYNFFAYQPVSGKYRLYKFTGNQYSTNLGDSTGVTAAAGDVLKVVLNGGNIKLYVNGTLAHEVTDTTNQTATKHGIGNVASTTERWDDFKIIG